MATTTLKSLASWLEIALCGSGHAGGTENRRVADFGNVAGERLVGNGVDGDFRDWPSFTLTMSVSSTFTSAVISDMSAMVMMLVPV